MIRTVIGVSIVGTGAFVLKACTSARTREREKSKPKSPQLPVPAVKRQTPINWAIPATGDTDDVNKGLEARATTTQETKAFLHAILGDVRRHEEKKRDYSFPEFKEAIASPSPEEETHIISPDGRDFLRRSVNQTLGIKPS